MDPPAKRTYQKNDGDGKYLFKPTPENFEGFLNSGEVEWEDKGTKMTFRDLNSCESLRGFKYECKDGFVTVEDPITGKRTCRVDKVVYWANNNNSSYRIKQEWGACKYG